MKTKGILRAILTVSFIGAITRCLAFVFRVFLSRKLGAEMIGVYQITTSIFMLFMCLTTSGIPTTLSRKTAQYLSCGDIDHSKRIFSMAMVSAISISVFICLVFAVCPALLDVLFTDSRCKEIFIVFLPSLLSTSVYCIIRAWFWGQKKFFIYSAIECLEEILKIILTVSLLSMAIFAHRLGVGVAMAYLIGDIIAAVGLLILYLCKGGRFNRPLYFKELMKSATPLTGTRLYGSMISSALALLLPALLINSGMDSLEATREFGRLSGMVMPIILAPGAIVGALAVVLVPELATTNNSKDYASSNSKIIKGALLTALITSLCLAAFLSSGKDIGILLYNDSRAGILLQSSCLLMFPLVLNQFTATALNSLAQENWTFLSHIIGSVVLLALLIILPQYVGIMAYTYSLLGFHSTCLVFNTLRLRKLTRINTAYLLDCLIMLLGGYFASLLGKKINARCYSLPLFANVFLTCLTSVGALAIVMTIAYFSIYKNSIFKRLSSAKLL